MPADPDPQILSGGASRSACRQRCYRAQITWVRIALPPPAEHAPEHSATRGHDADERRHRVPRVVVRHPLARQRRPRPEVEGVTQGGVDARSLWRVRWPTIPERLVVRLGELEELHSENATEPAGAAVPPWMSTTAESLTATTPVPMESPSVGIVPPAPVFGVVTVVELQFVIGGAFLRIVSL